MNRKIKYALFAIVCMICIYVMPVSAKEDKDYDEAIEEIAKGLNLDSLDKRLNKLGVGSKIDTGKLLSDITNGDFKEVIIYVSEAVKHSLSEEVRANKILMVELIAVALIGGIFINMSGNFGGGFVSENGFYVTYLIMTSIMLTSFSITLDMVVAAIDKMIDVTKIIVPVYAISMNYVGQTVTGAGMYQIIMLGVWLIEVFILKFIMPLIKVYVTMSMLNNISKEDNFSKMCQLIKNIINWLLKTIIFFVVGLNLIKSLIEPQIDALGRNTVTKVANMVPGGGLTSALIGTFLGAGMIIKNSIGVMAILLLLIVVVIPVVKTVILLLTVKLSAALIQPLGDKRYVNGIDALAKGMGLLLTAVFSCVVMFMLTIAIMAFGRGT